MKGRILFLAWAGAGLMTLLCGCGGLAFFDPQQLCDGPHCDQACAINDDCPAAASCQYGFCSTSRGQDPGTGGVGGGGGTGGPAPGDLIIILDDGRVTWGDATARGDRGPGDSINAGDYATGGDRWAPGDTLGIGDQAFAGDVTVTGDDGTVCLDPDFDGYCECCALGPDCPAVGCTSGTAGCGEFDPGLNPGVSELCDLQDNNCDGEVDEGVLNGCGNCAPPDYCVEDTPWITGGGGNGGGGGNLPGPDANPGPGSCLPDCVVIDGLVSEDEDANGFGAITLSDGTVATDFAWGANETEGTVSRVDTILGREVGRYVTVMWRDDDPYRPYVEPWGAPGARCAEPSRTTIDGDGNAFVSNRAVNGYSGQCGDAANQLADPHDFGSLTKIAYYNRTICDHTSNPALVGCQCVDRNGNGVIETSFDHNQDFSIDISGGTLSGCVTLEPGQVPYEVPSGPDCATSCVTDSDCVTALGASHFCVAGGCSDLPQRPEFLGIDDECLVWTIRIPGADSNANPTDTEESSPRGMAIDKEGFVWVGDNTAPFHFWKILAEPPSVAFPGGRGVFVCPKAGGCCRDGDDCSAGDIPIPHNLECPRTARDENNRGTVRTDPVNQCSVADPCFWTVDDSCRIDMAIGPYGAVIDSGETHPNGFGYLWTTTNAAQVQRVDTETGGVSRPFRATDGTVWGSGYGITIDHEDRPWLAARGYDEAGTSNDWCERPRVWRFNATRREPTGELVENFTPGVPADGNPTMAAQVGLWTEVISEAGTIPDGRTDPWPGRCWYGRGITTELIAPANAGDPVTARVWANFNNTWDANNHDSYIMAFDAEGDVELPDYRTRILPASGCHNPIGVGMGFEEKVWVVSQNNWAMCGFDPWAPLEATGGMVRTHHAPIGAGPYTYSDFTGNIFRSFTSPEGRYKVLVRACPGDATLTVWGAFRWDADVPGESVLEVRFRFGNDPFEAMDIGQPQILGQTLTGPMPPPESFTWTPPGWEDGIYCEVEFRFLSDNQGLAPILYSVDSARNCVPPG